MWLWLHRLFGWHYVEYSNSISRGIYRVIKIPNGEMMMLGFHRAIMKPDGGFHGTYGTWRPLTWKMETENGT